MTTHRSITLLLVSLIASASFAGCLGGGEGEVAVYVKDAPTDDWESIFVTFTEVAVHQGDEADENETGWVTVFEDEAGKTVDLLEFRGEDARAFLGEEGLEPGTYNQVLITVSDATGIRKDTGEEVDFTVTTGNLRLTRAFEVAEGETTRVILDFDLDRPGVIVQQGPAGAYRFTPVVGKVLVVEDAQGPEGDVQAEEAETGAAS